MHAHIQRVKMRAKETSLRFLTVQDAGWELQLHLEVGMQDR